MNIKGVIVTAVLALSLSGCGVSSKYQGGYTFALCSPEAYIALHVEINSKGAVVTDANPGPGKIVHLPKQLEFKYAGKTHGILVFVKVNPDGSKTTLLLKEYKDGLVGKAVYPDGSSIGIAAVKDTVEDLQVTGIAGFRACLLQNGNSDGAQPDATASN